MDVVTIVLAVAALLSGLFAGFIVAMTTVVQTALRGLSATEYIHMMQGIIVAGRKSPEVRVLLLGGVLVPIIALVLLFGETVDAAFGLVLGGWLAFLIGDLLVSRQWCEPLYDRIMTWDVIDYPEDWPRFRELWYRYNIIRALAALAATVCYLIVILV